MSTARLLGVLCLASSLHAQIWFSARPEPNRFPRPLMNAAGDAPVASPNLFTAPLAPAGSVVSLRELLHPIPEKAWREAFQAQALARESKTSKAIAKLENAIRIAPDYRDAHVNLGVQYARVGRIADSRAQLEKALQIGPPVAPIYFDLALAALALGQPRDAETYAKKALELKPEDQGARRVLRVALTH